jgi:ribokinase
MKVLDLGSLNIDLTFSVDHIVKPGETIGSFTLERNAGGKGANQAAALAKAGLDVSMAGKVGSDGRFLLDTLRSYGVNVDNVNLYDGATGQAIIQVDKAGQNAIFLFQGGNAAITLEEIDRILGNFAANDIIVLQNEIVHLNYIIENASRRGLKICLNPSPMDDNIRSLPLHLVDLFFVNEIEAAILADVKQDTSPKDTLEILVKKFPGAELILTAGKDGAYYGYNDERGKGDIVDVDVVDTTGAGDTFLGYFLAGRVKQYSVHDALMFACKASSIAVTRKGAMASIPFANEVFVE